MMTEQLVMTYRNTSHTYNIVHRIKEHGYKLPLYCTYEFDGVFEKYAPATQPISKEWFMSQYPSSPKFDELLDRAHPHQQSIDQCITPASRTMLTLDLSKIACTGKADEFATQTIARAAAHPIDEKYVTLGYYGVVKLRMLQ